MPLVATSRRQDLIYLNVSERSQTFTFNPFADIPAGGEAFAVSGLVEVFKKLWPDDWGPPLKHLLRNVLFALVETPGSGLGLVPGLLSGRDFRRGLVKGIRNEEVHAFWRGGYERSGTPRPPPRRSPHLS
ncbi:MAG TPA: hypothetical protein VF017_17100 [Thermoanaerobaculia bacterium]|nr:hypothetical protein [Thermoanaerobaculia bacterium]